jgi:hypothetical protein
LAAMVHQLSNALGVVVATALLAAAAMWRHGSSEAPDLSDFGPVFAVISLLALVSAWAFSGLPSHDSLIHPTFLPGNSTNKGDL